MPAMTVPFLDLKRQYDSIRDEVHAAFDEVLAKTAFVRGFMADRFQDAFAEYLGVKRVVGCNSGTDALLMALAALGIGRGDEVLVPANTFTASAQAVLHVGARPVFVDPDPATYLLDLEKAAERVTDKTKAVIGVDLYGQPMDQDAMAAFADKHGLKWIDDAAQAHGATFKGQRIGSRAHATCFSFYPGKNLGAYGDAGAVVTNDEAVADTCMRIGNHGALAKFDHDIMGGNSRLDGLQAAVLDVKLRRLDDWSAARRSAAERYIAGMADAPNITLPTIGPDRESVFHLFVVRVPDATKAQAALKEHGVASGMHYPVPCHEQPVFAKTNPAACPIASEQGPQLLSLPMFEGLTDAEVDHVITSVNAVAPTLG